MRIAPKHLYRDLHIQLHIAILIPRGKQRTRLRSTPGLGTFAEIGPFLINALRLPEVRLILNLSK